MIGFFYHFLCNLKTNIKIGLKTQTHTHLKTQSLYLNLIQLCMILRKHFEFKNTTVKQWNCLPKTQTKNEDVLETENIYVFTSFVDPDKSQKYYKESQMKQYSCFVFLLCALFFHSYKKQHTQHIYYELLSYVFFPFLFLSFIVRFFFVSVFPWLIKYQHTYFHNAAAVFFFFDLICDLFCCW